MTIARSMLKGGKFDVEFPEDHKPLDMADKYDSLYLPEERKYLDPYVSEEPTLKMKRPNYYSEPDVGKRYPGVGLLMCFAFGITFWSFVGWLLFHG